MGELIGRDLYATHDAAGRNWARLATMSRHEAPQSVFVVQHQLDDWCGRVARSDVQLQLVGAGMEQ
jgi:hypothetical protein